MGRVTQRVCSRAMKPKPPESHSGALPQDNVASYSESCVSAWLGVGAGTRKWLTGAQQSQGACSLYPLSNEQCFSASLCISSQTTLTMKNPRGRRNWQLPREK